jgi:hypothetical protein
MDGCISLEVRRRKVWKLFITCPGRRGENMDVFYVFLSWIHEMIAFTSTWYSSAY